jgi:hypothetical protein
MTKFNYQIFFRNANKDAEKRPLNISATDVQKLVFKITKI